MASADLCEVCGSRPRFGSTKHCSITCSIEAAKNTIKIGGPADNVGPDTSQNPSRTKRRPPSARHSHSGVGNPFSATSQEINSKKSPEWTPTAVQAEDDRKAKHRDQKANPSRSGNKVTRDKALFPVDDVALILLDMQDQYRSTVHEFPSVLSTTLRMIRLAKLFEIPVISLERNATNQNRRVREIDTVLDDSFHLFWNFRRQKTGGYIPEVVSLVNMWFKRTIIIVGLEVHTSVLQTALNAFEQGRVVYVVADGVSSRNREEIPVALEFMRQRGISVITSETLAFLMMEPADQSLQKAFDELMEKSTQETTSALKSLLGGDSGPSVLYDSEVVE